MIHTDKLTKRFRHVEAVSEVDLDVPEGAVYALLGPNGAGKTTLMRTLLNIWRPDGGSATLLGVDSRRITPDLLQRVGYVSESQQLPNSMRVAEFLRFCSGFYPDWDHTEAAELVRTFELPSDRRLRDLSRGMRLKAALVSVLAYRPKLLLLDEPFSGLDVLVRDEISEALLGQASQTTILLASHDLTDLETFASHVGYISQGRLLFSEDMSTLERRYREVEIAFEDAAPIQRMPREWPSDWLNLEQIDRVIRFTDSRFEPQRIRALFPGARDIRVEPLSLRRIFVALARSSARMRTVGPK